MAIFTTIATLAVSLAVGIAIGARLARATLGFLPSLYTQIVMFIALCAACVYLTDKPLALMAVVCTLVSTFAFWIARKTAPDPVPSMTYLGYAANEAALAKPQTQPQGRHTSSRLPFFTLPFGKRKAPIPERTTPTGRIIRLASSTDTAPTRKRGNLKAVK